MPNMVDKPLNKEKFHYVTYDEIALGPEGDIRCEPQETLKRCCIRRFAEVNEAVLTGESDLAKRSRRLNAIG